MIKILSYFLNSLPTYILLILLDSFLIIKSLISNVNVGHPTNIALMLLFLNKLYVYVSRQPMGSYF